MPRHTHADQPNKLVNFIVFCRIIISAPLGRANELEDTRVDAKGVIYICPILPGNCTGLMGNRQSDNENDRRLFDTDREY